LKIFLVVFRSLWTFFAISLPFINVVFAEETSSQSAEAAGHGFSDASPISLQEAIDRALENSPLVKKTQAELQAQIEARRGAWSDVGPRATVNYAQAYFAEKQTAQFGNQEIVLRDDKSKTGSLTVVQPLTGAFSLVDNAVFNGVQEDGKEAGYRLAKSETAFGVAEAYLRAFQAEEQLKVADQSIDAVSSQERDAEALERAGRINSGDLLKIKLAVSESKARAAEARAAKEIAFAILREFLGFSADETFGIEKGIPKVKEQIVPNLNDAYSQALAKRSDYQQAKFGRDAAAYGKKFAYSKFSPAVNAFVKWDKNFGEPSGMGGGEKGEVTRSYGLQLQWDIWNNGSHVFGVRQAISQEEAANAALNGLEKQVRLDVFQTLASLRATKEALALAEVAVRQAEEAFRIEQVRFKSGSRSATDLILAETSQSGARVRLVTARTNLVLWNLRLQKSLGQEKPII
jgi:outer membrane protein TolC